MGLVLVIIGAVLVLLAFTTLTWYSATGGADSAGSSGFSALHHDATLLTANGVVTAYFSWISWVVLILAIIVGTAASAVPRYREPARIGGLFLGLVGVALTYYALHAISLTGKVFEQAGAGVYLSILGYLLVGLGSAIGPWPFVRSATSAPARPARQRPPMASAPVKATPTPTPTAPTPTAPTRTPGTPTSGRPSPGTAGQARSGPDGQPRPDESASTPAEPPARRRPSPS